MAEQHRIRTKEVRVKLSEGELTILQDKSKFVERFLELSLFFKACRALYDEMICIFPYFCPCEIIVREIREISF